MCSGRIFLILTDRNQSDRSKKLNSSDQFCAFTLFQSIIQTKQTGKTHWTVWDCKKKKKYKNHQTNNSTTSQNQQTKNDIFWQSQTNIRRVELITKFTSEYSEALMQATATRLNESVTSRKDSWNKTVNLWLKILFKIVQLIDKLHSQWTDNLL